MGRMLTHRLCSLWISEDNSLDKSWFSQASECSSAQPHLVSFGNDECENVIPVITGYRPHSDTVVRQPAVRKTLLRENKCF